MWSRPQLMLLIATMVSATAFATDDSTWLERSELDLDLHGNVKTFFVASVPHTWFGLAEDTEPFLDLAGMTEEQALDAYGLSGDPTSQGSLSGRLTFAVTYKKNWKLDTHLAVNAASATPSSGIPGASTGVALTAPETAKLTWTPDIGSDMTVQARFDRLVLSAKLPHV